MKGSNIHIFSENSQKQALHAIGNIVIIDEKNVGTDKVRYEGKRKNIKFLQQEV